MTLSANATGTGNGGTISLTTNSASGTITVGSAPGDVIISAAGGGSSGNGGSVIVNAGGNLTVNITSVAPFSLNAAPTGATGSGANFTFSAGNMTLIITGTLNANGVGNGNGGQVNLSASVPYNGEGALIQLNGAISANSGANGGTGGSIDMTNYDYSIASNGIVFSNAASVTANGASGGGNVDLYCERLFAYSDTNYEWAGGSITAPGGTISANALASGAGGTVTLDALSVGGSGTGPLNVSANGAAAGNGGQLTINTWVANFDITVGNSSGQIALSATGGTGGTTPSAAGDGGKITLQSQHNIIINPGALNAGPLGANGQGPTLSFSAEYDAAATGPGVCLLLPAATCK